MRHRILSIFVSCDLWALILISCLVQSSVYPQKSAYGQEIQEYTSQTPSDGVPQITSETGEIIDFPTPNFEPIIEALQAYPRDNDRKFSWLREKRNEIQILRPRQVQTLHQLRQRSSENDSKLSALDDEITYLERHIGLEKASLEQSLSGVVEDIKLTEEQLKELKDSGRADVNRVFGLRERLEQDRRYQAETKRRLDREIRRDKEMEARLAALKKEMEEAENESDNVESYITAGERVVQNTNAYNDALEEQINLLLIPETADNEFKLYITAAFSGLVLVVILGFFIVAWRDDKVRRAIFSGESGIQFLTLFSLVIAIILFGILDILSGKELAALLGGLSGYILGRVTGRDRPHVEPTPSSPPPASQPGQAA